MEWAQAATDFVARFFFGWQGLGQWPQTLQPFWCVRISEI
jgi:hypothetical protein